MQMGQPSFQREEKTLDLPNALGTLPNQVKKNQNLKQKVEARKDAVGGGDFFFCLVCCFLFVWFCPLFLVVVVVVLWFSVVLFCFFF